MQAAAHLARVARPPHPDTRVRTQRRGARQDHRGDRTPRTTRAGPEPRPELMEAREGPLRLLGFKALLGAEVHLVLGLAFGVWGVGFRVEGRV